MSAKFDLWFQQLLFLDGTALDVESVRTIIVVGPNNAGKSRLLDELRRCLVREMPFEGSPPYIVVDPTSTPTASGTDDDWFDWLEQRRLVVSGRGGPSPTVQTGSPSMGGQRVSAMPPSQSTTWPAQTGLGLLFAGVRTPLSSSGLQFQSNPPDLRSKDRGDPLQELARHPDLETELSEQVRLAFGFGVTVDRAAVGAVHLLTGSVPPGFLATWSVETRDVLDSLTHVRDQGDGVKAFVATLMDLVTENPIAWFVDEPEALLHPPQATQLGRALVRQRRAGSRLVVATHSSYLLRGLLEASDPGDTLLIRVTHDEVEDRRLVHVLDRETVTALETQPVLKYSGLAEALFYREVVICEAASDCWFYEHALGGLKREPGGAAVDAQFVHGAGVGTIPLLLKTARALGLSVRAIVDFDVLLDAALVARLAKAGDADLEDSDRNDLAAIGQYATNDGVRDHLKGSGLSGLAGTVHLAALRTIEKLEQARVFVVPNGELESWDRTSAGKAPGWLIGAFENRAHENPEVQEFVRRLLSPTG